MAAPRRHGGQQQTLAYWRLDDTGTSAADFSGDGHTGTYSNATHTTGLITGDPDKATQFNGTSTKITVPDSSDFHSGTITVEAWINCNRLGSAWRGTEAAASMIRMSNLH